MANFSPFCPDTMLLSNLNTVEELQNIPRASILVNNSAQNQCMLAKELGLERSFIIRNGIHHTYSFKTCQAIFLCKHGDNIYRFQFSSRDNDEMYKALFKLIGVAF
jgi:hypothetical protein